MKDGSSKIRHANRAAWIIAITIVSTMVGMIVSWRAPGLDLYARDRLMQARGPLSPPDDIVIVAIDEASISRYGRFPWQRGLTARALDAISSTQPKAIAVDILYSDPTESTEDATLADSIRRSGNTIVGAQLIETTNEPGAPTARWLRPLPPIENAAAGVGHVNVSTEADGAARELPLRKADSQGQGLWSIAVETIRVGEGIRSSSVRDVAGGIQLGSRIVPIASDPATIRFATKTVDSHLSSSRADRMIVDYLGPPGSFSHQTFSFADLLDGRVSPQSFRGKYVLIGATAASLGDHIATPFTHGEGHAGEQHGEMMPGVEVLANSMNTILRSRFYREIPDWLAALFAALVAAATVGLLAIGQGRFESAKQITALLGLLAIVLTASYFAFVYWLIVPPVAPVLLSFATAAPLTLLRRSLKTSADLDARIAELSAANDLLLLSEPEPGFASNGNAKPATLIANLTGADTCAIYLRNSKAGGRYRLVNSHGPIEAQVVTEDEIESSGLLVPADGHVFIAEDRLSVIEESVGGRHWDDDFSDRKRQLSLRLGEDEIPSGALIIRGTTEQVRNETLRLCAEIAANYLYKIEEQAGTTKRSVPASSWWRFPRGVEWKTRALGILNRRMLARARFVDRALRAVEDGLIVADISGSIVFANPRAAEILGVPERLLVGRDLFQQLRVTEHETEADKVTFDRVARETLMRLVIGRATIEREISVGDTSPAYYMLRMSAVTSGDDGTGQFLGLVAALSNVTHQHELEEMKTDVMTLVTHELLTPLTAIQGMSEVLAQYEVQAERRREMHLAINDEAKRLSHMIKEYLDISRLESGAHQLRQAPVRIGPLVERVLLLLDPLASQRNIRIERRLAPELPALLADADLIAQALTNLIANAIKYSPPQTEIVVRANMTGDALVVEVEDQGYGIPADALSQIFEKFYRVPRVEDADVHGTGLGLALVREIVELHGGRVTVESEPGAGSIFSVRLPLPTKETKDIHSN
jgi:two-component system phosphate regulon sensor histidine kinase PhoR